MILSCRCPPICPSLLGDPQCLEQVLTNLVGNAIKFTLAGGVVTITAELNPDHITIMVTDTGPGIAEAELVHIFTKFYQAQKNIPQREPGNGLGLHISKQLIEKHNGKIWAESKPNQGSTFFVQLPLPDNTPMN